MAVLYFFSSAPPELTGKPKYKRIALPPTTYFFFFPIVLSALSKILFTFYLAVVVHGTKHSPDELPQNLMNFKP